MADQMNVLAGAGGSMGKTFEKLPSDMKHVLTSGSARGFLASKLIATLGPSSSDANVIAGLLRAGMKLARLDFTWGTAEQHQVALDNLNTAMEMTQISCAVILDTRGRQPIVLNRPDGPIVLTAGSTVTLTCDQARRASASLLPVSALPNFSSLSPGDRVFVGQALFASESLSAALTVTAVDGPTATCVVDRDASLEGLQVTVHCTAFDMGALPPLCADDIAAINGFGRANGVDFVALSYTRSAEDVAAVRAQLQQAGLPHTKVMAKIECLTAVKAHKEIIDAADVVVLSRGNLGVALAPEKVFLAQKLLVRAAGIGGKPVFVSRVVDSMTEAPRPTRAEATDVANLVLDGADGIVLGSETFRGSYPVEAATFISDICRSAEECFSASTFYQMQMETLGAYALHPDMSKSEALASSAVRAAGKMDAKLIIVFTVTGNTARMLSKYKPSQPVLCVVCPTSSAAQYSSSRRRASIGSANGASMKRSSSVAAFKEGTLDSGSAAVARQCLSFRGVIPIMADASLEVDEQLNYVIEVAKEMDLVRPGDRVVVSQCPRKNKFETMEEAGVVILQEVE